MSAPAKPVADSPAKKKGKLPLIAVLIVLLAGGGGGGYVWWTKQQAVKAAAGAAAGHETGSAGDGHAEPGHGSADEGAGDESTGVLVPLDSFTVNLADTDARRFLRTNVQLVIDATEDELKEIEEEKVPVVRARALVLELLTAQTSEGISTPEGKAALKTAIKQQASKVLHHKVSDVLFSDFVIQF